jgi:hypothetical protein
MKLITANQIAKTVPEKWAEAYRNYRSALPGDAEQKQAITLKLSELKNPTPKKVAEIIGNDSWTDIYCFECGEDHLPEAVEFDNAFGDDDTDSFTLCFGCIKDAGTLKRKLTKHLTKTAGTT